MALESQTMKSPSFSAGILRNGLAARKSPPSNLRIVDCLSCEKGCNGGTGTRMRKAAIDDLEGAVSARARREMEKSGTSRNPKKARSVMRRRLAPFWKPGIYDNVSLILADNPVVETVQVAPRIQTS